MALHFQIDGQSGLPVYRQLMDQIKYYVASGALVSGDQLPSIRELAQSLALNPTTIVKAYNELAHERVLELRQGKGAFVGAQANMLSAREREKTLRRMARQLAVEASQMGIEIGRLAQLLEEEAREVRGNRSLAQELAPVVVAGLKR